MKKIKKLKICDWCLLIMTLAMLVSGVQLEATDSRGATSVWIHIAVGILFFTLVAYHIFLHFSFTHSPIGGVHGKIGFFMIILAIGHICKRIKFFKSNKKVSA